MRHATAFILAAKTQGENANKFESVPPLTLEPPFDGKAQSNLFVSFCFILFCRFLV